MSAGRWPLSASGCAVIGLSALAGLAVAAEAPVPLRTAAVLGFFLVVPGLAIVDLLPVEDPVVRVTVAVAVSVTAAVLVGTAMLALRWWHPKAGLALLGVSSSLLVLGRTLRARTTAP